MVAAIAGGLANARWHPGLLQAVHGVVGILRSRPFTYRRVEGVLVSQTPSEGCKARIRGPTRLSCHGTKGLPFRLVETGNGDPPVLSCAGIDPMRCGRFVRRAIAVTRPDATVCRPVEYGCPIDEQADFGLRGIDPLPLSRALAVVECTQHRQG